MAIRPAVALHTDRTDVGQKNNWALPDMTVHAGGGKLFTNDRVSAPQNL